MSHKNTPLADVADAVEHFVKDRFWEEYHWSGLSRSDFLLDPDASDAALRNIRGELIDLVCNATRRFSCKKRLESTDKSKKRGRT